MASLLFVRQSQLRAELGRSNQAHLEASLSDPLTGARNRRYFDETISGDSDQIVRSHITTWNIKGRDLIFYMVDVDCLKEVNDGYGHHAGDDVLKEVTKRIAAVIRSSDVLVRWGGDEFLIVSRYADRREAEVSALRILVAVGASDIALRATELPFVRPVRLGGRLFPGIRIILGRYPSKPF